MLLFFYTFFTTFWLLSLQTVFPRSLLLFDILSWKVMNSNDATVTTPYNSTGSTPTRVYEGSKPVTDTKPVSDCCLCKDRVSVDAADVWKLETFAYFDVVHWQKNTFTLPFGKAGKGFVFELSRLLRAYVDGTAPESIALMATIALSVLLLQKPLYHSKQKVHCLVGEMPT